MHARLKTALLFAAIAAPMATAQSAPPPALSVKLLSEEDSAVPAKPLHLGVLFTLQPGWHVYWINPGDSGEPPKIEWKLPPEFTAGNIQWPTPRRLPSFSAIDYGYENSVLLMATIHPPASLQASDKVNFGAHVSWIVCREVCIPGKQDLTLMLPVAKFAQRLEPDLFAQTRQHLPESMPADWKAQAISTKGEFVLFVHSGAPQKQATFFPLVTEQIADTAAQEASSMTDGVRLRLRKSDQLLQPILQLKGVVAFADGKSYWIKAPVQPALHGQRP